MGALRTDGYKKWMMRISPLLQIGTNTANPTGAIGIISVGVLYMAGLSEHLTRVIRSQHFPQTI